MNRIEKWFSRHDMSSTKRKMKEWGTDDPIVFFKNIYHTPLTNSELVIVYFYFSKKNKIDNHINYDYI